MIELSDERAAELLAENKRLKDAMIKQQHDIGQTLGKALGYPPYPEDWKAGDDVCTGDHVAESLADEIVQRLSAAEEKLREEQKTLDSIGHFMVGMVKFEKNLAGVFVMERYDFLGMRRQSHSTGAKTVRAAIAAARAAGWDLGDTNKETKL